MKAIFDKKGPNARATVYDFESPSSVGRYSVVKVRPHPSKPGSIVQSRVYYQQQPAAIAHAEAFLEKYAAPVDAPH